MTKEFKHPFLGIQYKPGQCPGKVHALRYNANPNYVETAPLSPFEIAAMYSGAKSLPPAQPKMLFGVVTMEIGDPRAEWHKVNSIKHAEQIVLQKSAEERLQDWDSLAEFAFQYERRNPTEAHIHWMISRASRLGQENRRGFAGIWFAQADTFHRVLDGDPRPDMVKRFFDKPSTDDNKGCQWVDELAGYPVIGHINGCHFVTSPDVKPDVVHQFYKGPGEIDAVGYVCAGHDGDLWLCLPLENPLYDNDRPYWHNMTRTLQFRLDRPEYDLPHHSSHYEKKNQFAAAIDAIKDIVGKF